jgi:aryl-alcohol dehydrogenase-like predicted oxidoreductase
VVLLHSVSAEALVQGEAMAVLEAAKARGDVRAIGVSVDEISAAEATLADPRIEVVQVPYITGDSAMVDWARRAAAAGKLVVAREIFSGIGGVAPPAKSEFVASNLARVEGDLAVGVALVGTTKIEHLDQVLKVRMR